MKQPRKGKLFVVSGPSGSGKSTLTRMALEKTSVILSVSATTRQPGKNEVDGRDYYFLSKEKFQERIEKDMFLEHAQVFDNFYGTPAPEVLAMLDEGKSVLLEIDIQGALQVFNNFPEACGVLILPPDEKELKRRLDSRGRDDEQTIAKRIAKAQWETQTANDSGKYKHTIVNDELDEALDKLVNILN